MVDAGAERDAEIDALGLLRRDPPAAVHHLLDAARLLTGAERAQVNVLTSVHHQVLADTDGPPLQVGLGDSMCARTLGTPGPDYQAPDATLDSRFDDVPAVQEGKIVGYAAVQLITSAGVEIGTVCVFSASPLEVPAPTMDALAHLGAATMVALESDRLHSTTQATLDQVSARAEELRRSNAHLVAFAGQVGHDVQGPLATVSMALELLGEELAAAPADSATLQDLLTTALSGAHRLQDTVSGLLHFAELGGRLQLQRVDVSGLVDDAVLDLAAVRGRAAVERELLPEVVADVVLLRTVVLNLLANAFKYTGHLDHPVVRVCGRVDGSRVRLLVEDNGPGVPRAQRGAVFGLMVRGEGVTVDVPGLGIGLATCRRVAELHGGRIGVGDSDLGGAAFWLELPVRAVPEDDPVLVAG